MEQVIGSAYLKRIGVLAFPTSVLVSGDRAREEEVIARLGRDGWFRVFFGPGRRVELPDGTQWRVAATGAGSCIVPVVTCEQGKLAMAEPAGKRSYGINGPDYAYNLYPANTTGQGKRSWTLREHETELATFESRSMYADHPVPLAAVLVCFTVIKHGVPGEASLFVPQFSWG
jgi:hypothetical protein